MKRFTQSAIILIALGAMAAAQAPAPPATPAPAPKARAVPAVLAVPAVPAPRAAPAAPAAPGKRYSYLGVTVRDINAERASALKLKDARGAEIVLVDQDSPAGKAGLKDHDVVLSFNGRNVQTPEELRKLIRETPPGQTVELGVSRDGQPMTIKTQLADRHRVVVVVPRAIRIPRIEAPIITTLSRRNGVVVENLTPQLGEVFGVKDGEGVLVRQVDKGSAGDTAGLRAGDVIVRVGNEHVASTSDWNRLMREQKAGPVQIGIVREKRQQSLSITIPERTREQSFVMPNLEDYKEDFSRGMEEYKHQMLNLERLQPEIERAMREAQETVQRELEGNQREIERAQREQERVQRDAERAQERAQRQAERARERSQRKAEQEQERAQREAERAREKAERDAERVQQQAEREQERREREQEQAAPANPPQPPNVQQ